MSSAELEQEACALVTKYGLFMPAAVKAFLKKMADHLNWLNLQRKLQ